MMRVLVASLALVCSLCCTLSLYAQDAPEAQEDTADPMILFEEGMAQASAKQYQTAIETFRRVFALDPNPFVLFNIGRCYEELDDLTAAARYYQRAISLDGLPENIKTDAMLRLERVEPILRARKLVTLRMMASQGLGLSRLSAERAAEQQAQANMPPPEPTPTEPLPLPPPPMPLPERGILSWSGLGTAGLGLALMGTGTAFYLSLSEDLEEHNDLLTTYNAQRDKALAGDPLQGSMAYNTAQRSNVLARNIDDKQTTTGLLLGTGTLLTITGLVMYWWDTPVLQTASHWRLSPESISFHTGW